MPHSTRQIGEVVPDVAFGLTADTRLQPDLAIILNENRRALDLDLSSQPFPPDIAIEVISPSERTVESSRKVRTYLNHGVTEVWQIYPGTSELLVHRTGRPVEAYRDTDLLRTPLLPE